jgi:hypothetical protein
LWPYGTSYPEPPKAKQQQQGRSIEKACPYNFGTQAFVMFGIAIGAIFVALCVVLLYVTIGDFL